VQAIELLPEREKLMMALYYEQDLNLREIGEVMGVSESRVCQLHSQAVMRCAPACSAAARRSDESRKVMDRTSVSVC
jgi:RNA polymerase sigma factor for flagellar operon FliA